MILALVVGVISGLGAVARYVLDRAVSQLHPSSFPFGTLTVNVTGSLLLGLVTGLAVHRGLPSGVAVVLSAGFCSGFTTWSTYIWESLVLADAGARRAAVGNLLGSLVLGLAAAVIGYGIPLL